MKHCDFRNAKVGDRVWDIQYGWGVITDIDKSVGISFPIIIWFYIEEKKTFDIKGRMKPKVNPTLFWNEFEIPNEAFIKPLPKLEVDTLVWVWDNFKGEKLLRFFSHFDEDGNIYTFDDGGDSSIGLHNTTEWDNWELYEPKKKDS